MHIAFHCNILYQKDKGILLLINLQREANGPLEGPIAFFPAYSTLCSSLVLTEFYLIDLNLFLWSVKNIVNSNPILQRASEHSHQIL